ncbi:zinc-dependent alcohol dehydrogenase [Amnibacterium setariae]|uniref:Alcohol dehydrogenase n=1 Tax=Amnibacterium setariae TaxID=2306585 RepID=A0A3A1U0S2_9MICO|nr:alcohol dehydrogenase catalytic domain-containing protein [Amnibacterium setariae]RIX30464.1 alcohol dehydrogenase [Amnibacterium setariae]
MRALVVDAPRAAAVREVPDPVAGPGELLVEVERAGICGTDVELWSGEMAYIQQGVTRFPLRLGHEWVGRVLAAGSSEDGDWAGRRVTGDTMIGCGRCAACTAGRHHVCPDREEVGIRGDRPGALAERLVLPTRVAHRIPEHVGLTAAALVEPGGNALRAVHGAAVGPGSRLLVLGSGTIGLLVALFALAGGAEVHVAGVDATTLALARDLGAHATHRVEELAAGPQDRFDAVVDATNDAGAPALALRLVRPAGRVVLIGLSSAPSPIDTRDAVLQDVTLVGVLSASPALEATIAAYASGAVVPDAVVGELIALEEVPLRFSGRRGPGAGRGPKIHIDPRRRPRS